MERNMDNRSRSNTGEKLNFALPIGTYAIGEKIGIVEIPRTAILEKDGGILLNSKMTRLQVAETATAFNYDVFLYKADVSEEISNNDDDKFYHSAEVAEPHIGVINFDSTNIYSDMTDAATATQHIQSLVGEVAEPISWATEESTQSLWAVFVAKAAFTIASTERFSLTLSIAH